jgi:uncharacterized protein (DUF1810 family)
LPHLGNQSAEEILGPIDAMKLASSMEIFGEAAPQETLFRDVMAAIR